MISTNYKTRTELSHIVHNTETTQRFSVGCWMLDPVLMGQFNGAI